MGRLLVLLSVLGALILAAYVEADCGAGDPAFVAPDKRDRVGLARARAKAGGPRQEESVGSR